MSTPPPTEDWDGLAFGKLSNVLGADQARRIMSETLARLGLAHLTSADDLYRFAQEVGRLGGFASAVGGLLGVTAVMRGANARR
jgi:hypothetical protein